jgi:DNA-binding LacI/PurR family transcriptional regulator
MNYLQRRRKPAFQSVICALTTRPPSYFESYTREVAEGAKQRALALGYGYLPLDVSAGPGMRRQYERLLRSRGVEGVLILPLAEPADLHETIEWQDFSAVAATSSLIAPLVHRVAPAHAGNVLLLCQQLTARRYRRIGLVISAPNDLRVNHSSNATIMWHNYQVNATRVRPLIFEGVAPAGLELRRWFKRERPDVIVVHDPRDFPVFARLLGVAVPSEVSFACACLVPPSELSGIDELPQYIGAAAIDLLSGLVQRRECGLPAAPTATLLQGRWHEGTTCPARDA